MEMFVSRRDTTEEALWTTTPLTELVSVPANEQAIVEALEAAAAVAAVVVVEEEEEGGEVVDALEVVVVGLLLVVATVHTVVGRVEERATKAWKGEVRRREEEASRRPVSVLSRAAAVVVNTAGAGAAVPLTLPPPLPLPPLLLLVAVVEAIGRAALGALPAPMHCWTDAHVVPPRGSSTYK
jgi:hypothetical protein